MISAKKVEVWAATCEDRPGGMMRLLEGLSRSGADLKFILARRLETEPNKGVLFVSPLAGERQISAAKSLGFAPTRSICGVCMTAADEPGLAYLFSSALAKEGINLRSMSGIAVRDEFVAYLTFDSEQEADRAIETLNQAV